MEKADSSQAETRAQETYEINSVEDIPNAELLKLLQGVKMRTGDFEGFHEAHSLVVESEDLDTSALPKDAKLITRSELIAQIPEEDTKAFITRHNVGVKIDQIEKARESSTPGIPKAVKEAIENSPLGEAAQRALKALARNEINFEGDNTDKPNATTTMTAEDFIEKYNLKINK